MAIEFKTGVVWRDMHVALWVARMVIEQANRDMFPGRTLVVTDARSPRPSGLHPHGRALDLRTRDLTHDEQRQFTAELVQRLGEDYDVVLEGPAAFHDKYRDRAPHIHVEYDPPEHF